MDLIDWDYHWVSGGCRSFTTVVIITIVLPELLVIKLLLLPVRTVGAWMEGWTCVQID